MSITFSCRLSNNYISIIIKSEVPFSSSAVRIHKTRDNVKKKILLQSDNIVIGFFLPFAIGLDVKLWFVNTNGTPLNRPTIPNSDRLFTASDLSLSCRTRLAAVNVHLTLPR